MVRNSASSARLGCRLLIGRRPKPLQPAQRLRGAVVRPKQRSRSLNKNPVKPCLAAIPRCHPLKLPPKRPSRIGAAAVPAVCQSRLQAASAVLGGHLGLSGLEIRAVSPLGQEEKEKEQERVRETASLPAHIHTHARIRPPCAVLQWIKCALFFLLSLVRPAARIHGSIDPISPAAVHQIAQQTSMESLAASDCPEAAQRDLTPNAARR